jgi:hypothetical protein
MPPSRFLLSPPAAEIMRGFVAERGGVRLEPRRIAPPSGGGASSECAPAIVSGQVDGGLYEVVVYRAGMGAGSHVSAANRAILAVTERAPQATVPVGSIMLAHRLALVAGDDGSEPPVEEEGE